MRRSLNRLLLIAFVAAVVGFYPLLAPTTHRIDRERFELIQKGMTRAEVEALFAVPPGRYDGAEPKLDHFWIMFADGSVMAMDADFSLASPWPGAMHRAVRSADSATWVSRHGAFTVAFDDHDRLAWKSSSGSLVVPPWQRWWQAIRRP
jgi:hypothetical protein